MHTAFAAALLCIMSQKRTAMSRTVIRVIAFAVVYAMVAMAALFAGLGTQTLLAGQPVTPAKAELTYEIEPKASVLRMPASAAAAPTYTVKSGDTLGKIAAANGTSVDHLKVVNGIANVHHIRVGQVLKLGGPATAAPAASVSSVSEKALAIAQEIDRLGEARYKWGASGPNSFDCSGFIRYTFGQAGKEITGNSSAMSQLSGRDGFSSVTRGEIKPGDIVFFAGSGTVDHVGMATDNDNVVHASTNANPGPDQIKNSPIDRMHFHSAIRFNG